MHILSRLDVPRSAVTTPIFQAFMDYRLGWGETVRWGDCQLGLLSFQPNKLSYDIAVDIIDAPNGDCTLTFIVRDDLYSPADIDQLSTSYMVLAKSLAAEPTAPVGDAEIFDEAQIKKAVDCGRGMFLCQ